MPAWKTDDELFKLITRELYTPVVGDILDSLNHCHQFLPPTIRPLATEMRLLGRAMPVLQADVFEEQAEPFGLMTQALDDLQTGEIYVATGGTKRCANWGEIMTAAARARGARGAVINGYHRDTPRVLEQAFAVFSQGGFGQDSRPRMKVIDFRCTIEIDGVSIKPGDLVFGDRDGVLVIPARLEEEVIELALEKARGENRVRREIENGISATEALRKYGIL